MNEIIICMGSSCFARGNNQNIKVIKDFLAKHNLESKLEMKGKLCQKECSKGPVMTINGQEFQKVETNEIEEILTKVFLNQGEKVV